MERHGLKKLRLAVVLRTTIVYVYGVPWDLYDYSALCQEFHRWYNFSLRILVPNFLEILDYKIGIKMFLQAWSTGDPDSFDLAPARPPELDSANDLQGHAEPHQIRNRAYFQSSYCRHLQLTHESSPSHA